MKQIVSYSNTKLYIDLYDYTLRSIDFDHEPIDTRNLTQLSREINELAGCYFLILTESKISDVSTQLLVDLRKKRSDVVGQTIVELIPQQLSGIVEDSFSSLFESETNRCEMIVPFLGITGYLLPFRVRLDIRYHVFSGLQRIVHFMNSDDLTCRPTFFYCANTDRILHGCPLFFSFLQFYQRRADREAFGHDLFGVYLSNHVGEEAKSTTVNCFLLKQRMKQENVPVTMVVRQVYRSEHSTFALISIESS